LIFLVVNVDDVLLDRERHGDGHRKPQFPHLNEQLDVVGHAVHADRGLMCIPDAATLPELDGST